MVLEVNTHNHFAFSVGLYFLIHIQYYSIQILQYTFVVLYKKWMWISFVSVSKIHVSVCVHELYWYVVFRWILVYLPHNTLYIHTYIYIHTYMYAYTYMDVDAHRYKRLPTYVYIIYIYIYMCVFNTHIIFTYSHTYMYVHINLLLNQA